ncbi:hypothetical protein [Neobacillus vireti]|uniref:Integral membrane protein n=1 Tax=Neobacillus vireti LMG 21834 TaxID=1131730 RepID=A0AB94IMN3_9BACI|nr:hypothetical protein [Neobacillus vireti]ETI68381.1 hypothetical protein BAVI_12959 [Neobacillus vireti LMG 21834]
MKELLIHVAAIIVAVVSSGIAIFQVLLFLGFPLAEYSWGGKYQGVLPKKMRMMSLTSALLLLFFGFIFLLYSKILTVSFYLPTNILVIIITIFMGLNTLGNLASKSNKEKLIMTPLAGITFLSCLLVVIFA